MIKNSFIIKFNIYTVNKDLKIQEYTLGIKNMDKVNKKYFIPLDI